MIKSQTLFFWLMISAKGMLIEVKQNLLLELQKINFFDDGTLLAI